MTGPCVAHTNLRFTPGEELEQGPIEILTVQKRRMMGNHRIPQLIGWLATLQARAAAMRAGPREGVGRTPPTPGLPVQSKKRTGTEKACAEEAFLRSSRCCQHARCRV